MIERGAGGIRLTFDVERLAGRVEQAGGAWVIDLTAAPGVAAGQPEPMLMEFPWTQRSRALDRLRPLRPTDLVASRELSNGVELDFRVNGADFRVRLTLGDDVDEVVFALQPLATGSADLIAADLPGALRPADESPVQVLMAYRHQGRLFTGAPGALEKEAPEMKTLAMHDGRHRLRLFGVLGDTHEVGKAHAGYLAIIEENADARVMLRQGDAGRLAASVAWMPSHGTLAYPRVIRYRFQERPTVTTLAKAFRRYAMSAGMFKPLREKIAERPLLERLLGATACFIGYQASDLDYVGTFRRLREMGHERFYIFPTYHVNINFAGFGGERLIDIRDQAGPLRDLGGVLGAWAFLAGTPDDPARRHLAARNADGTMPLNWQMAGEDWPQTCMRRASEWLAGCERDILGADAHHFDTTASNSLMECYAPTHPMDRRGDRAERIKLFQECTRRGRVVASEGVKDWAVPHYDVGSNKEAPVAAETPAFRVVPLQHLVYHDALFSLWWELDCYDVPYWLGGDAARQSLTDLLYGDMPLLFPVGRQYRWADRSLGTIVNFEHTLDVPECLAAAQVAVNVARHFKRVATEEMTDFAWLTADGRVQQTQFGNGVSVIANFGDTPYRAPGGQSVPPLGSVTL
jgi:hypothetical protein